MNKLRFLSVLMLLILIFNSLIVVGIKRDNIYLEPDINVKKTYNDFYFVHITDTHIMHKFFIKRYCFFNF